jgi:hypothetical protein
MFYGRKVRLINKTLEAPLRVPQSRRCFYHLQRILHCGYVFLVGYRSLTVRTCGRLCAMTQQGASFADKRITEASRLNLRLFATSLLRLLLFTFAGTSHLEACAVKVGNA